LLLASFFTIAAPTIGVAVFFVYDRSKPNPAMHRTCAKSRAGR
jgi:hypothetical protein